MCYTCCLASDLVLVLDLTSEVSQSLHLRDRPLDRRHAGQADREERRHREEQAPLPAAAVDQGRLGNPMCQMLYTDIACAQIAVFLQETTLVGV